MNKIAGLFSDLTIHSTLAIELSFAGGSMRFLPLAVFTMALFACTSAIREPSASGSPASGSAAPLDSPGFLSTVEQAAAALAAGSDERARYLLRTAHAMVPTNPRVLLYLAQAELKAGDTARAFATLELLAEQGAQRDVHADPVLGQLRGDPSFEALVERMLARAAPLVRSDTAFQLADPDFLPEGVAYDPGHDAFYVGSLGRGTIIRVDLRGDQRELANVATAERALVIGLRVDSDRRRLWAATLVVDSAAPRFRNGVGGRAMLQAYDLETGRRLLAITPEQPGPHLLNDIAIAPSGDIYVTDSEGGALYRLRADENRLERVYGNATDFTYPNGVALASDGTRLYVAHVEGISTFQLRAEDAVMQRVAAAPGVATVGIDGLYACQGGLLAVQSMLGFQRIVLLHLDESGRFIVRQEPLEQQHPAHDAATTGALAHGAFYYIANAQLGRLDVEQRVTPGNATLRSVVLRLPVPAQCQPAPKP